MAFDQRDPGDEHQDRGPNPAILDFPDEKYVLYNGDTVSITFDESVRERVEYEMIPKAEVEEMRAQIERLREQRDDSDRCLLGATQALHAAKGELAKWSEAQIEIEELYYLIEDTFIALQRRRFEEDTELRELRHNLWNVIRLRERT